MTGPFPSLFSVEKIGYARWEAIVSEGNIVYYFYALSSRGAVRKASRYISRRSK